MALGRFYKKNARSTIQPEDKHLIKIRVAKPTYEEGILFARYLDEAAEGFFRFMLGKRVTEIVAMAFTQPSHDLSYQNVSFAEKNNVIVGMVSGYTAEQHRNSTHTPLKHAAGKSNIRMSIVRGIFAPLIRIMDSIEDSDFYLLAIAVDKEQRGSGVGSLLLDYIEERARATGSTRMALDVSSSNVNAFKLYRNRGMTVTSQWPRRLRIPKLKFYRMTKAI